jgi:hypothetical protein
MQLGIIPEKVELSLDRVPLGLFLGRDAAIDGYHAVILVVPGT